MKQGAEINATELFYVYKEWCLKNGSLSRGRRPFLDAIATLGAQDGIAGVIRGKSYTFKNLALKTK
jgi:phage/plasmid-associated DNA primase